MNPFRDLFSNHARKYARYRPNYPAELFELLLKYCEGRECLWDCGTGNGQVAVRLAERFKQVYATDPSQQQLDAAQQATNIDYRRASAENSGLDNHCCDMVTVAQALHWFNFDAFHKEVGRVIKPGGVIAVWCYQHFTTDNQAFNEISRQFYHEITAPYWAPERQHIDEGYANIPFPYQEVHQHSLTLQRQWSIEAILNYMATWSAVNTCKKEEGHDLIEEWLKPRLNPITLTKALEVRWPIVLKLGTLT